MFIWFEIQSGDAGAWPRLIDMGPESRSKLPTSAGTSAVPHLVTPDVHGIPLGFPAGR